MLKRRKRENVLVAKNFSLLSLLTDSTYVDYTGVPTAQCPCGNSYILIPVMFDENREIADYGTTGWCSLCGSMLTVVTADPDEFQRYGGHIDNY